MKQIETKPRESRLLQPLREIGLANKTQCWDLEDIQAAIREAVFRGISIESLYATADKGACDEERRTSSDELVLPARQS